MSEYQKCEDKAKEYFERWQKYKIVFSIIMMSSIIAIIGQVLLFPQCMLISKILLIVMGVTYFILPFGNTVDMLGIKRLF